MRKLLLLGILSCFFSCKERMFRSPSGSMEQTIMMGETFAVTKTDKFERNDIVVFNHFGTDYMAPQDDQGHFAQHWEKRVSRLIAYSGDSVEIKNSEVYINSLHVGLPPRAMLKYEVLSTVPIDEFIERDEYTTSITNRGDTMCYLVDLTTEQAFNYRQKKPAIISVKKKAPDWQISDTSYARASATGTWTSENFGPFRIPAPGETIFCDSINFKFYHNIPGITRGKYLIKEKLYFVLGDNRFGAEDSRFIGLISHSKMYGVVK